MRARSFAPVLAFFLAAMSSACGDDSMPPADAGALDAGGADAGVTDGGGADSGPVDAGPLPQLGVYAVNVDGSAFRLLLDTGTRQLTHVRKQAGTDWMTATRYNDDVDGNGFAMELEDPYGAYYSEAEVVVFPMSDPSAITQVAGGIAGKICANSSWTEDGRLIYLQQDHPSDPNWTRLKRARFSPLPTVADVEVVATPPELFVPIDPHQVGPSDDTGSIVFVALYHDTTGWMRPVWRMAASGTTSLAASPLVGCPICASAAGCCAWPTLAEVLGTNDPRMSHAGTDVIWMQQHPDVTFGTPALYPERQAKKPASGPQVDLMPPGVGPVASQTFVEWREDDQEVVYWSLDIESGAIRQQLHRMKPDGTERALIPIPDELCAQHPSYISATEIVFTGWRCAGTPCSCQVGSI